MRLPDDVEGAGVDVDRRDVVKSMGMVGLALNGVDLADLADLDGDSPSLSTSDDDDDPGWLTVSSTSAGLPTPRMIGADSYDDEDYRGHMVVSNHGLDYKGARWVEFGDPKDGIGGCWKHTFVLSGLTAALRDRAVGNGDLYPDTGAYESTQFVLRTEDDDIAISERRDRDLTGFIPTDKVMYLLRQDVEVDGEPVSIMEALRNLVANGDDSLSTALEQTADDPTEAAQKEDAKSDAVVGITSTVVGVILAAATGGVVLGIVVTILPLIVELLSNVEYQPSEVPYSKGVSAKWDADTAAVGGGEFATFDVYVSPEAENATFTVESNHSVEVAGMSFDEYRDMFQCRFDFNPKPTWEIQVDGEPRPEELGANDDPHNARVRGGTTSTHQWMRDGRTPPVADVTIEQSPPTTGSGLTVDAGGSVAPDGTIESYEWTLETSPTDGVPQPIPGDGDGRTRTGETAHFAVAPGNYTIHLTVTDDNDKQTTTARSVTVTRPPSVSLSASTTTPDINDRVGFTATASDPDDEPLTYYWSAVETGDSSDGPTPGGSRWPYLNGDADTSRTLDAIDPGATVDVTVTVMDPAGATARDTVTVEIPERNAGNGNGNGGDPGNGNGNDGGGGPGTSGGSEGEGPGGSNGAGNGKGNGGGNGKGNGRKSSISDSDGAGGLWSPFRGSDSEESGDGLFRFL